MEALSWLLIIFIAVALATAMRVLLLASFKVGGYSMYPALHGGDHVLVNKMIPGPRIPVRWGNFFKGKDLRLRRLVGYRGVKRNDVLVFNFPYTNRHKLEVDMNVYYTKRCVAVPGDTFFIDNGIYRVKNAPDTLGSLAYQQKVAAAHERDFAPEAYQCHPRHPAYGWNLKNFGPLYVPRAGDTAPVDTLSVLLYKQIIEYEANLKISFSGGQVLLGSEAIDKYVFKKSYYFVAGDHATDSRDSRYWGLLPEDHIVGKAFVVWKSKDPKTGKWRWKRFFTKIV